MNSWIREPTLFSCQHHTSGGVMRTRRSRAMDHLWGTHLTSSRRHVRQRTRVGAALKPCPCRLAEGAQHSEPSGPQRDVRPEGLGGGHLSEYASCDRDGRPRTVAGLATVTINVATEASASRSDGALQVWPTSDHCEDVQLAVVRMPCHESSGLMLV